jgi:hypothetical protein
MFSEHGMCCAKTTLYVSSWKLMLALQSHIMLSHTYCSITTLLCAHDACNCPEVVPGAAVTYFCCIRLLLAEGVY